jgi:hypothetical protein
MERTEEAISLNIQRTLDACVRKHFLKIKFDIFGHREYGA